MFEKSRVINADCLEILQTFAENSFDCILTDPPYGLTSGKPIEQKLSDFFRKSFNIVFPKLNKSNSKTIEYSELISIMNSRSSLGRSHLFPVIEPWVTMPECSIDFNCYIPVRNEEVNTGAKSSCFFAPNDLLMDESNLQTRQYIGNYILDFGDSVDFSTGNINGSNFGEFLSGSFTMPISSVCYSGNPGFLSTDAFLLGGSGIADLIGDSYGSFDKSECTGVIMTSRGAEHVPVLRFDLAARPEKDISAHITTKLLSAGLAPSSKLVRTGAATSRLSSVLEPYLVSFVVSSANGAITYYFLHLWLPKNFLSSLHKIKSTSSGFMGKSWDHGIPGVEYWKEMLRVLKPGGHLMAFGGTRTFHRLTCYIEDAGFELRDCIMWLYGQGFPKSLDISKALDKYSGKERKVIGTKKYTNSSKHFQIGEKGERVRLEMTSPESQAAKLFEGYGSQLKPAWEPIVCAMKPLDGNFATNALKHGLAGLNIDAGRIGTSADMNPNDFDDRKRKSPKFSNVFSTDKPQQLRNRTGEVPNGRFPANLLLSHGPDCTPAGNGTVKTSKSNDKMAPPKHSADAPARFQYSKERHYFGYGGEDGQEQIQLWDCEDGCPVKLLKEQSGFSKTIPKERTEVFKKRTYEGQSGAWGLSYNKASSISDSGHADRFFKVFEYEPFFYTPKASPSERGKFNKHPTVKPLKLMTYLLRLMKPPEGGVVLDPFLGSGTTALAAREVGMVCIGIEKEAEYVKITKQRWKEGKQ